jgi:hypothetical protein
LTTSGDRSGAPFDTIAEPPALIVRDLAELAAML